MHVLNLSNGLYGVYHGVYHTVLHLSIPCKWETTERGKLAAWFTTGSVLITSDHQYWTPAGVLVPRGRSTLPGI